MSNAAALKIERLVNLTVALLDARRPRTFAQLRDATGYWGQADQSSARRQFERDKDELRRLGVPVETRPLDASESEWGYTIDRSAYELPEVDLDRDEVAALAIALRVANRDHDRLALNKLTAMAPDPVAVPTPGGVQVRLGDDPPDEIARAVVDRHLIRFTYRPASGDEAVRTLAPYGVVQRRGRRYVVGHDQDRDALRSFRLDRIVGTIRVLGDAGAYAVPDGLDLAAMVEGPTGDLVELVLDVAPSATWAIETHGGRPTDGAVEGRQRFVVDEIDERRAANWVLGLVPDVVVVAPEQVRQDVIARLRALVDAP